MTPSAILIQHFLAKRFVILALTFCLLMITSQAFSQPTLNEKSFSGWIGLTASNLENGNSQDAYIFLNNEATDGFDVLFDGKFKRGNGPVFYSQSGYEQLTTNSIPSFSENVQIEFVFKPEEEGEFQIEASGLDLVESQVFMYDNVSRLDHNFSLEPMYQFNAIPSDDSVRFTVHFQSAGLESMEVGTNFQASYASGILNVSAKDTFDRIVLFEMSGKKVIDIRNGGMNNLVLPLQTSAGIYILRCFSGNKSYAKKLAIR
jgi:hypothetical protein